MSAGYTIHQDHHHRGWHNANAPALNVAPGDVVEFEVFSVGDTHATQGDGEVCGIECADLRVSEIVDVPNWLVSLYFPRFVLE